MKTTHEIAQEIAQVHKGLLTDDQALVAVSTGGIGIVTRNESGYLPLKLDVRLSYATRVSVTDKANALIFPHRDNIENLKIVLTTFK